MVRRRLITLASCAALVASGGGAGELPRSGDITERVETRIVQVDVSVIDRGSGSRASVAGLTKDMFRLRVNNRRLDPEAYARVGFDQVCGADALPPGLDTRSLIVMADFNYLDGQMRWNTAQALRSLADAGVPAGTRVKVIGYTRFLFEIQGFTSDSDDLRAAADFIETASGIHGPGVGPDLVASSAGPGAAAMGGEASRAPVVPPPTATGVGPTPAPASAAPPSTYTPGDLGGASRAAVDASGGDEATDTGDPVLQRLTSKLSTVAHLPDVDFGPSLSSDPFRVRAGTNPGASVPDSMAREMAWSFDFDPLASFQQVQSAASLALDLVPENSGRSRIDRLGFWDPRASLAAIGAVLRGHAGVRGRKALVVFTGEAFRIPNPDDRDREMEPVIEAAQGGFSLWMVEARGFHEVLEDDEREESGLLTALAKNTGGEPLRDAGDLATVFSRIEESLDCYYLFSIPVPRSDEPETLSVTVSLDTEAHKELFGYTVVHDARVRIHDRATERELARTAALLNPGDWKTIPLRADLAFPLERERRLTYLPVEVSIPIGDLDFRSEPDGGVAAEFLVDIAVDRNGREAVCLIPPPGEAQVRKILLPHAPPAGFRGNLVIRNVCPYRGAGLYTLRAVLTEPSVEVPGGAQSMYRIDPRAGTDLTVTALRIGHNTGQDYYLVDEGEASARVSRDRAREAFVPLTSKDAAAPSDRLIFRYVLCGPSRSDALRHVRRLVYRDAPDTPEPLFLLPGSSQDSATADASPSPFCVEVQDDLPPDTLTAGRYGFAVLDQGDEPLGGDALREALRAGRGPGLLGQTTFAVAEPGTTTSASAALDDRARAALAGG